MTKSASIWLTTASAYADRLAAFALPLLVLKALGRIDAYAAIEYVVGLSTILATFFDLGLRNYVLFHSRLTGDAKQTTTRTAQAYAPVLVMHGAAILMSALICWSSAQLKFETGLIALSITRASALSIIGLSTQLVILQGRPALAPMLSLAHWTASLAAFLLPAGSSDLPFVALFFGPSVMLVAIAAYFIFVRIQIPLSASGFRHLRDSLAWGWPILVAAAANMLVANFSKVYAISNFPSAEIVPFIFWLRIYSIVLLSHTAAASILSLEIYRAPSSGLIPQNLRRYATYVLPTAAAVFIAAIASQHLNIKLPPTTPILIAALGTFVTISCVGSYFEAYLNRDGKTLQVLISAIGSSSTYITALLTWPPRSTMHLALIMCASATVYLSLVLWFVYRLGSRPFEEGQISTSLETKIIQCHNSNTKS